MPLPPTIATLLAAARSRVRTARVATALGRWLALAVGVAAAALVVDAFAIARIGAGGPGDRWARLVLDLGIIAVLGRAWWRGPWTELRRAWGDQAVALLVERLHPDLGGRLVSAVEFAADPTPSELATAAIRQADQRAAGADPARVVDRPALRRALIAAGLTLVAALALIAWRPAHARAFAQRLALQDVAYPAATRILAFRVPALAVRGEPVAFTVELDPTGSLPEDATVEADAGDRTFAVTLTPGEPGSPIYRGSLPQPMENMQVRAQAGDARWPRWENITVHGRPAVTGATATLEFPTYLGRPTTTVPLRDLRVPGGTRLGLALTFSQRVASAHLRCRAGAEERPEIPVKLAADGLTGRAAVVCTQALGLTVTCLDPTGLGNPEPVEYRIAVDPDLPPTVTLTFPTGDHQITRRARWPLRFTAEDDHGLATATMMLAIEHAAGGEPEERKLPLAAPSATKAAGEGLLDAAAQKLVEGDRVTAWIEVRDNQPGGGQATASRRVVFSVADAATVQERFRASRDEAARQLGQLPDQQRTIADTLDHLGGK